MTAALRFELRLVALAVGLMGVPVSIAGGAAWCAALYFGGGIAVVRAMRRQVEIPDDVELCLSSAGLGVSAGVALSTGSGTDVAVVGAFAYAVALCWEAPHA